MWFDFSVVSVCFIKVSDKYIIIGCGLCYLYIVKIVIEKVS